MSVTILEGDARHVLRTLPDGAFDCIVSSPPYYAQRDYGIEGQIGLESTPTEYVEQIVAVFREARRTLSESGVMWLNLGDCYNNRTKVRVGSREPSLNGFTDVAWKDQSAAGGVRMSLLKGGLKEKDLFGIPWLVAFALRSDGWFLRQEIIWSKSFCKPESVADRLSKGHEHLFLLSKSKRYSFDRSALPSDAQRSVWTIPPGGYGGDHGAVMPPEMAERCIQAGCPAKGHVLDPFGGAGTTALAAKRLGRCATLIEINPAFVTRARERIAAEAPLFAEVSA